MVISFPGPGMAARRDIDRADTTPLGAMPPAAALVGLPCTATSAPGGSISSVAGIPSTPVLGDMLSLGGLLTLRLTTKIPAAGAYVGDGMPPVPAKLAARIRRWDFVGGRGGGVAA